jgi:hypothetical protein
MTTHLDALGCSTVGGIITGLTKPPARKLYDVNAIQINTGLTRPPASQPYGVNTIQINIEAGGLFYT